MRVVIAHEGKPSPSGAFLHPNSLVATHIAVSARSRSTGYQWEPIGIAKNLKREKITGEVSAEIELFPDYESMEEELMSLNLSIFINPTTFTAGSNTNEIFLAEVLEINFHGFGGQWIAKRRVVQDGI